MNTRSDSALADSANVDDFGLSPAKKARNDVDEATEDPDYKTLRNFFVFENFWSENLSIASYIGLSEKLLQKIQCEHGYGTKCVCVMKAMFDLWFPTALRVARDDDVTPREILAHAYLGLGYRNTFLKLLPTESKGDFGQQNTETFQLIRTAIRIEKEISNMLNDCCDQPTEQQVDSSAVDIDSKDDSGDYDHLQHDFPQSCK